MICYGRHGQKVWSHNVTEDETTDARNELSDII